MKEWEELSSCLVHVLPDTLNIEYKFHGNQIGAWIKSFDPAGEPHAGKEIVLLGVCDGRGSWLNEGCSEGPDEIRKELFKLYANPAIVKISDAGNIPRGNKPSDTWFVLSGLVKGIVKSGRIPVILGGGQENTYAIYKAYESLEQLVNLVTVDSRLDLGKLNQENESDSFLGRIILHEPNYLFNYSNLGYQTYLVDPESIALMDKLFFDCYRLGWIRDHLEYAEPVVRNADILSLDLGSARYGESPACINSGPNGFYGEELCQIARYAGLSDKLTCFGLFEFNPSLDIRNQSAQLAAQIVWCFCEGVAERKGDFPNPSSEAYLTYRVFLPEANHEIIFMKSKKSDRWWMKVPYPADAASRYERHHLVPCHYSDYQLACEAGMPDRWWQTFQKLI